MRGEHVEYRGGDSQIALAVEGQRHLLAVPRAAPPRWPGRRGAGCGTVCVACGVLGDEVVAAGVGWVADLVVVHAADETTARRAGHGQVHTRPLGQWSGHVRDLTHGGFEQG